MQEKEKKIENLQEKSREVLMKILNNIGVVGAILAAIADIIFVIIFVVGIDMKQEFKSSLIFAIVNALIGILINVLLRYQGQKYAEIENEDLCNKFYRKKIKESKRFVSMATWNVISVLKDFIIKGLTTAFSICGIVYVSIEGSKNPIQILITLVTLVLFACFGLISMNSSYYRFYNVQVPYMELKIKENKDFNEGDKENGII